MASKILFASLILTFINLIWYTPCAIWVLSNGRYFNKYTDYVCDLFEEIIYIFRR